MKTLMLLLAVFFSVTCSAASLIDQVAAMQAGTWSRIFASNSFLDVDPGKSPITNKRYPLLGTYNGTTGFKSVLEAWNSAGLIPQLGQCGTIVYYGGGHNNHFGSEIVGLDLCGGTDGAPIWKLLANPYDSYPSAITWPYSPCGVYPDGSPSPSERFDTVTTTGSAQMWIGDAQVSNLPERSKCAFMYDFNINQWLGPFPHRGAAYGGSAFDPKRNLIWFQPNYATAGEFSSFDPVTKEFKYYGRVNVRPFVPLIDQMMGYDPVNDILFATSFRQPGPFVIAERDPNNPAIYWKLANQINPPPAYAGGQALAWSPARGAWIVWMDMLKDGKVWELRRTAVNNGVAEYTWTLLTDAANTVIPSTVTHNPAYEKFQLLQVGGVEVLLGQLRGGDGLYAFRLPGGSLPPPPPPPPPPGPSCIPQEYNTSPPLNFCPVSP